MASEGRVFRDWIPEGEDGPAAKLSTQTEVRNAMDGGVHQSPPDYIPAEGTVPQEDIPMEDKIRLAEAAAAASVARFETSYRDSARRQLAMLNDNQVIDLMRNLSPAEREIYLQEESQGQNRDTITGAFGQPDEEVRRKAEERGAFGAAHTSDLLPGEGTREAKDLPMESTSPSDVLHRAIARVRDEDSDTGKMTKEISESVSLTDDEKASVKESAAAGYENVHGFRDDSASDMVAEGAPDWPAINAAKANAIAEGRAQADSEEEANNMDFDEDAAIKEATDNPSTATGFSSPADLPGVEEVTVLDFQSNVAEPKKAEEVKEDMAEKQAEAADKAAEAHAEAGSGERDADSESDDLEVRSEGNKDVASAAASGTKPKTQKSQASKRAAKAKKEKS